MDEEEKANFDRIFKSFDANGDGQISAQEFGDALKKLGSIKSEEITTRMAEIDTDGDGFISHEELLKFATAHRDLMKDFAKIM